MRADMDTAHGSRRIADALFLQSPSPTPAPETPAPVAAEVPAAAGTPVTEAKVAETSAAEPLPEAEEEPLPEDPEGIINMEIFSQIQDMDDDDDDEEGGGHEFSKGIVWGYFEQAENTFKQMEEAM
jgi:osomolarity two-component system phosphorelay intermediate protein YPD1